MVTDPVCFTELDEQKARLSAEFRGQKYYFDSEHCREVFERDPTEYVGNITEKVYGNHGSRFKE